MKEYVYFLLVIFVIVGVFACSILTDTLFWGKGLTSAIGNSLCMLAPCTIALLLSLFKEREDSGS
jgi:hypothetical protein